MKGKDQSTLNHPLLAGWDESAGWRESHLYRFTQPEDMAALRRLAAMLYDYALQCGGDWPPGPAGSPGDSPTRQEVRAAAADLKHDAGFLATVGQARVLSSLSPEDVELSKLADQVADEVGRLAERLARAVE